MKILRKLMEMDPLMRPIGGPVAPHRLPAPPEVEAPPETGTNCPMCSQSKCGCSAASFDELADGGPLNLTAFLRFRDSAEEEERIAHTENDAAVCGEIIDFLKDNEHPTEQDFAKLANTCGIEVDDLMSKIYAIAHAFVVSVGKHSDKQDEDFDAEQLAHGVEVEKEHTSNEMIAKMIAKDHLSEFPDYYTGLKKMEQDLVPAEQGK